MKPLFKTEEDAIKWVSMNIPFGIKPKKMAKTKFIYPFSSFYAHDQVVECLGKTLYKYQQEKNKKHKKD
jgi:hypothetical protein